MPFLGLAVSEIGARRNHPLVILSNGQWPPSQ